MVQEAAACRITFPLLGDGGRLAPGEGEVYNAGVFAVKRKMGEGPGGIYEAVSMFLYEGDENCVVRFVVADVVGW